MQQQVRQKKYTFFIGTDISRNKLDHVVMKGKQQLFHREIKNEPSEIDHFIEEVKALPGFTMTRAVFCMEQTGIYGNHLVRCLQRVKANIVVEGALQIRNSLGNIRGKNDKVDAMRIGEFAYKNREHLRLWVPKRPVINQLANLSTLRSRLLALQVALQTPLTEQVSFEKKGRAKENIKLCSRSTAALKADLKQIDECIANVIASDERLKRLQEIVTSVHGVGPVTALQFLICTNEFRDINNPKKFACYAGVAPFTKESGTMKSKAKVSPMANKKMKALLHACALAAYRSSPDLRAYFERKTGEGKHRMLVFNAIRYKIILRVFACVNQNRCYEKEYVRKQPGAIVPEPMQIQIVEEANLAN